MTSTDDASSVAEPGSRSSATPPRSRGKGRRYLTALDGLRAICAFAVIIIHTESESHVTIPTYVYTGAVAGPLFMLFFAISGFVLYRAWARKHLALELPPSQRPARPDAGGGADGGILRFLARRLLRIYPLYWVVATAALLVNESSDGHGVVDYLQVYLISPFPDPQALLGLGLGIVVWTLLIDVVFYLYVGLHGAVVSAILKRRRMSVMAFETITLLTLALVFPLIHFAVKGPWAALSCLPLGMLYAVVDGWQELHGRRHPFVRWVLRNWWWPVVVYVPMFIFGTRAIIASSPQEYGDLLVDYLWIQVVFVLYGLWFLACIIWGPRRWAVNRALTSKVMVAAGALTYGTYLWHPVVLSLLEQRGEDLGLGTSAPGSPASVGLLLASLAITLLGSTFLAAITFRLVEQPLADQRTKLRTDDAASGPAVAPTGRRRRRRPSPSR